MSTRLLLSLVTLALAAACSTPPPGAHGCQTDPQCPSGTRCTANVCTGDTRPTAKLAALQAVQEFELVELDGSASVDPDGDVTEHRWSIRAVDAACAAPEVTSRAPVAKVRFGCSGRFEVTLTVRDALGLDSDPARMNVTVGPATGTPIVTAGADVATDHVCTGEPLRCRPTIPVRLQATAASNLTLRWTVQSPAERPLDETRHVTLSPSWSDRSPNVELYTDGTGISGDWIFRVEAVDAYGVIGAAHTRVSIRNRPPVVTFGPAGAFPHAFDRARSVFTSRGAVAWTVTDPDGDRIEEVTGLWRHVGDGDGGVFDGDFDGTTVKFQVEVPYAVAADGKKLRGGADLVREIELSARDANREIGSAKLPIEIGNRPPELKGGVFDTSVPHHFDPQRSMYVAYVQAGAFVDPDGDPIVDSTGPGLCGTLHARADGTVMVECALAFEGQPIVDQLVGTREFSVPARDPWDAATQVPVRTVQILNSPPTVTAGAPSQAEVCAIWHYGSEHCKNEVNVQNAEYDVSVSASDPDGDPVLVGGITTPTGSVTPTGMVLKESGAVRFHFVQASFFWHCWKGNEPPLGLATATDGTTPIQVGVGPRPVFYIGYCGSPLKL
jgi:hypothetical protein